MKNSSAVGKHPMHMTHKTWVQVPGLAKILCYFSNMNPMQLQECMRTIRPLIQAYTRPLVPDQGWRLKVH